MRMWTIPIGVLLIFAAGCGTTRMTDTSRTATEQLLVSDAIDRAVSDLDFRALAGRTVCLDSTHLNSVTDHAYLVSSLRQHMLAAGCLLKNKREEADYIVEARAGAVGTDRNELMVGVPAVNLPTTVPGLPSSIPEMPLIKRTEQRAVAKVAVFAYNAKTGRPVWQSGVMPIESKMKDTWVAGAGPFQKGHIHDGMKFAGDKLRIPLLSFLKPPREAPQRVAVANEAFFTDPETIDPTTLAEDENPKKSSPKLEPAPSKAVVKKEKKTPGQPAEKSSKVVQASHTDAAEPQKKPPSKPSTPQAPADPQSSRPTPPPSTLPSAENAPTPEAEPPKLFQLDQPDLLPLKPLPPSAGESYGLPPLPERPDRLPREPVDDPTLDFRP